MKTYSLFLVGCLLLTLLTSCATATQETPLPSTTTPVPATFTPEPTSCEKVKGDCLELSIDGESCTYEGPTDLKPGPVALIFHNDGDGWAAANLIRLLEDKTLEDLIHWIGEEPSQQHQPPWSESIPGSWKEILADESRFWEGDVEPGIHALFCVKTPAWPESISVWFGKTWTIGN
ncbi:MAG TPA: hypothetical protein VLE70_21865 [Anaerolineae bacterium]|nr:hypothetical protein [Anaerolineae bacterium]